MNMLRHRNRQGRNISCRNDFLFPIETQFNKIFDQFFQNDYKGLKDSIKAAQGYPKMDVVEDDGHLWIKLAVPGLKKEDLSVEVTEGLIAPNKKTVTISGKMSDEYKAVDETSAEYIVRELRHSSFKRVLELPEWIEGEPEAELKDGILVLRWKVKTKSPEQTQHTKVVEIQ